jgi:hypothetical protein
MGLESKMQVHVENKCYTLVCRIFKYFPKASAAEVANIVQVLKLLEKGLAEESVSIKQERVYAASLVKEEPGEGLGENHVATVQGQPATVMLDNEGMPIVVPQTIAAYFSNAAISSFDSPGGSCSTGAANSFMSEADQLTFALAAAVPFAPPGHQQIAARAAAGGCEEGSLKKAAAAKKLKKAFAKRGSPMKAAAKKCSPKKAAAAKKGSLKKAAAVKGTPLKAAAVKGSPLKAAAVKGSPLKAAAMKGSPKHVLSQPAHGEPDLKMTRKNVCSRAYHGRLNECLKLGLTMEDAKLAGRKSYQQAKDKYDQ